MKKIPFILLFVISGCSLTKNSPEKVIPSLIIQDNYLPAKDNADFTIISADLKKDNLTLIVQYGGGCKDHE